MHGRIVRFDNQAASCSRWQYQSTIRELKFLVTLADFGMEDVDEAARSHPSGFPADDARHGCPDLRGRCLRQGPFPERWDIRPAAHALRTGFQLQQQLVDAAEREPVHGAAGHAAGEALRQQQLGGHLPAEGPLLDERLEDRK